MRIEIIAAWIFVGLCLLFVGTLLSMFEGGNLGKFLMVMGGIYFCIGIMLILKHDRHMAKRMRAGRQ